MPGFGGGVSPVSQQGSITKGGVAVWLDQGILVDGSTVGLVTEAPQDGQTYGRQDGLWIPITGGGGGTGTLTSITAGTGLSGGTITSSGTIALQTPVSLANGGTGVSVASAAGLLTALGGAPLNSAALTGTPTLVTPPASTDDSNALATTAWVTSKVASATAGVSQITATTPIAASASTGAVALSLATVPVTLGGTGATTAIAGLAALGGAPLLSPPLTGTPTAPTATAGTNTTQIATTAFVETALGGISAGATTSATAPPTPSAGDLWLDTTANQLKVWNGTAWVVSTVPSGGAQYDVLSKASATDGDVAWRMEGVRPTNNVVLGPNAFAGRTTGFSSVAIGNIAMRDSTTANFSVAVGAAALAANVVSTRNTAVGMQALLNFNGVPGGGDNVAVGADALQVLATGVCNIGLGSSAGAGATGTSADHSIFIGRLAVPQATGQINQIVIGSGGPGGGSLFGNGSNTITLGNAAIAALYTRAGLVLGDNPTGGAQGTGTINCTDGYFKNGQPYGFAQTAGWVAGTDPDGAILFTNNTGRTLTIISIVGQREIMNTTPAVIDVYSAAANQPIGSGTIVTVVASFDAGDIAPEQTVNLTSGTLELQPGERLGLVVAAGAAFDDSVASISVYLA